VRVCLGCKETKSFSEFTKSSKGKFGFNSRCKTCRTTYNKTYSSLFETKFKRKEYSKAYNTEERKRAIKLGKYGITEDAFTALLEAQDNRCAICSRVFSPQNMPSIDHDHACCPSTPKSIDYKSERSHQTKGCGKCVRGLLCRSCNTGLGMFMDNTEYLVAAVRYLMSNLPESYPLEEVSLESLDLVYEFEG